MSWVSAATSVEVPCGSVSEARQREKSLLYPLHLRQVAVKRALHSLSWLAHMCKSISQARGVLPRCNCNIMFFLLYLVLTLWLLITFYKPPISVKLS